LLEHVGAADTNNDGDGADGGVSGLFKDALPLPQSQTTAKKSMHNGDGETTARVVPDGAVVSTMGGSVVSTKVLVGAAVNQGDVLVVMTSMKMETVIRATHAGTVVEMCAAENAVLQAGDVVAVIEPFLDATAAAAAATVAATMADKHATDHGDSDRDGKQWHASVEQIMVRRKLALEMGGESGVGRQHAKGRLTLRERIRGLLDAGTLREVGKIAGGSVVNENGDVESFTPANFLLGTGKIDERPVVVGGEDFTISGGSPTTAGFRKSVYAEGMTLQLMIPLVRLHEGGGGSVAGGGGKGDKPVAPVGDPVFSRPRFESVAQCLASVPVATAALGPVAGLPASRLVASHFAVMVGHAQVITAGPKVVERALGYAITKEELGGVDVHMNSGVVDNIVDTEAQAFHHIRRFLSYLPANVHQLAPVRPLPVDEHRDRAEEELLAIIPSNRKQTYDMRRIFQLVFDKESSATESSFFEIGNTNFGKTQITGFARLNGQPVGVFGNDCCYFAGALTWDVRCSVLIRI
jgi:biotin carboxyl carrier protein/acetyl-CoA carboxylase beta subunit